MDKLLPRSDPVAALPHGEAGAAWLSRAGWPELGPAVAGHPVTRLVEPGADRWLAEAPLEVRLVAYADKRAGQRLVSMAARFAGWARRYPDAWDAATARAAYDRARRLEADVCSRLAIFPADVRRLRWTRSAWPTAAPAAAAAVPPGLSAADSQGSRSRMIADGAVLGCFSGDDGYGLERRADALAERLTAQAGIPPERRRTTGAEADAGRLEEWLATAPLFGGGTLVVVSEPGPLVRSAAQRTALASLFERIAPGNGLVFLDPVDGSAGGRRPASHDALRDAVKAAGGETAELKAPTEGRLAAWIEDRARERSIRLGQGAARELGTRVGGFVREGDVDRRRMGLLAVGELEKLALYRPDGEVTVADVRALVPEAVPSSSWAFLDAVGLRDTARAGTLLPDILDTTPEPVLVSQLHRRLRELIEVADHLDSGATPASLVRTLGQKPFRVEKLVEQARRWTVSELIAALDGVLALDERIKGLTPSSDAQRRLAVTLWLAERVGRPTPGSTDRDPRAAAGATGARRQGAGVRPG